jgi:peptidoglycan/LPS O-acetylase OafA/YrhL
MIIALALMFLTFTGFNFIQSHLPLELASTLAAMFDCLDYEYYGWFAAGALFYRFYVSKHLITFLAAIGIAIISARGWGGFLSPTMLAFVVIIGIFAGAMVSTKCQRILSNKLLTFTGFISYPLYLIHENATISSIVQLHAQFDWMNVYALSLLPLSLMVFIAWIMAAFLEPDLRKWMKTTITAFRFPYKIIIVRNEYTARN